ncbi:oligosaccharyl transferase, archaeosortase A system-associated [Haloarcula sp. K1]|uniref:oligosaccharyl transferase, archaeosortase A system-associated n=1 Tax=Haloarcula sp. K1 TaxID=1622207 RepID=UPI0007BC5810|nr:oligosaccharyl transferase, archaeosortase A system-associated [Haloarcula sp. K1]KZX46339.1 hypothetical protein AV929_16345 [Haloarcula sp. K1]
MNTSDEDGSTSVFAIFHRRLLTTSATQIVQAFAFFALAVFIIWNRIRNYSNLIQDNGEITFQSADAWYHRRNVRYTADNFPNTLSFDPFTTFPTGNHAGQFGTVFDQFLAVLALIIGRGNPSASTIDAVLLFAPPALGVITIVPLYLLVKELGTSWGGLVTVLVVALTPGLFLSRTVAGFADHHVAETLLVATALYFYTKALTTHRSINPPLTLSFHRLRKHKPTFRWSFLAGISTGLYLLTWPAGVFFIASLAVFFHIQVIADYIRDREGRSTALLAAVSMGTTSVIISPFLTTISVTATETSILQAALPVIVGLSTVVISEIAYRWEDTTIGKAKFLLALGVAGALGIASFWVVFPEIVAFFIKKSEYVIWFVGEHDSPGVAEASSLQNPLEFGFITYGVALITAVVGWGWMLARAVRGQGSTKSYTLLVVFSATVASATVSQVRFDYYLVIAISILSGWAVQQIYHTLKGRWEAKSVGDARFRAKIVTSAIIILIIAPFAISGATLTAADNYTSVSSDDGWRQTFDWIESGTPAPGSYRTGGSPRLEYTGAYSDVGDFQYRNGEYGIMTRWSAGHRLTVETHRIPVSNPHQWHAPTVADILLETDESAAIEKTDETFGEASGVPYVILDDSWGSGNNPQFANPAHFEQSHDLEASDLHRQLVNPENGEKITYIQSARSYQSLRTRLYQFHGSAAPASSLVVYYNATHREGTIAAPRDAPLVREFKSPKAATEATTGNPTAVQGGLYKEPSNSVRALEHFRLVYASEQTVSGTPQSLRNQSSFVGEKRGSEVKVFERVEGATITGTASPGTTVKASVNLSITTTGKRFTYTQYTTASEDGTFELTVPYGTTGYSEYTTSEGYTDTSVRALGPYEVVAMNSSTGRVIKKDEVAISEGAILGESDGEVVVFE